VPALMIGVAVAVADGRADWPGVQAAALGADALALYDVDAASGRTPQLALAARLRAEAGVPVWYRGSVGAADELDAAAEAADVVCVAGAVLRDAAFLRYGVDALGERLAVVIEHTDRRVQLPAGGHADLLDAAGELAYRGVHHIIVIDRGRAGVLSGLDLETVQALCEAVGARISVGGGVGSLADIAAVARMRPPRPAGVLVGSALRTGRVSVPEILASLGRTGKPRKGAA
jgi:phosphoribosylformimino-5-aminoimidazole carboxamide ribotide isomerase